MISEQEYLEFKQTLDLIRSVQEQAAGAVKQIEEELRKEYKCKSLKAAKRKLARMREKQSEDKKKFEEAFEVFLTEFGAVLSAMEENRPDLYRQVPTSIRSSCKKRKKMEK